MRLPRSALVLLALAWAGGASAQGAPPRLELDHVPVAVRSLEAASRSYTDGLGFRLKPGRPHPNGLRNAFAKFGDGSYLELIAADSATDDTARWYAAFARAHEGGAFLSLEADSLAALAEQLEARGHPATLRHFGRAFSILALADTAPVFFIAYPEPVRDPPALLDHPNTALGIETVWLEGGTFASVAALLAVPGGPPPGVLRLARGAVARAPGASATRVAGVTVRVRSVDAARESVRRGTGQDLPVRTDRRGRAVTVQPELAHGLWIEFLERGEPASAGGGPRE